MNNTQTFTDRINELIQLATKKKCPEPTAMNVATVTADGWPDSRIVLLKHADKDGLVFYTNLGSTKAQQIDFNPKVALCFHWQELRRQVRVMGRIEKVSDAEADAYFDSRARQSRIGAWASIQSTEIKNALDFEKRLAKFSLKYAIGHIPRPEFWSGYRVVPHKFEFWTNKEFRLHEREVYTLQEDGSWNEVRIYP